MSFAPYNVFMCWAFSNVKGASPAKGQEFVSTSILPVFTFAFGLGPVTVRARVCVCAVDVCREFGTHKMLSVGVITPYKQQLRLLKTKMEASPILGGELRRCFCVRREELKLNRHRVKIPLFLSCVGKFRCLLCNVCLIISPLPTEQKTASGRKK